MAVYGPRAKSDVEVVPAPCPGAGERPLLLCGNQTGFFSGAWVTPLAHVALTDIHFVGDGYDGATTTLWLNASQAGSFTLTSTASDAESGIASVDFPAIFGTGGNTGTLSAGAYVSSAYAFDNSYTADSVAAHPERFTGVFSIDVF